jgi:CubicO group peptidase (beta-lactamase class C family)
MVHSVRSAVVRSIPILTTLCALLFFGVASATAGPAEQDVLEKRLDDLIGQFLQSHAVPGLAVGVVKDGRVVYVKGFGVAELGTDRPVTP